MIKNKSNVLVKQTTLSILKCTLVFVLFFLIAGESDGQIGRLDLSPLQKMEQNIARTDITIVYSRPSARERKIFGGLVKFNEPWRTGANRNTVIEFSEEVVIGKKLVPAGKYAIITIPSEQQWEFMLYSDTDNWNVPDTIEEKKIVAQIEVAPHLLTQHVENLTIEIGHFNNYEFDLSIRWEKTQITVPIQLTTRVTMDEVIAKTLSGPTYVDYYSAATYEFESGKNHARGLDWINKAIDLTEQVEWWDYRIKSYLLLGMGNEVEAKEVATKGLKLAEIAKSAYGIREFSTILNE